VGSAIRPEFFWAETDAIVPNNWNPNEMDADQYEKAVTSIRTFGFVVPIVVRPRPDHPGQYEIIDGENRWQAAKDEGLAEVPISYTHFNDSDSQQLTIILNEVHGQPNPQKLGALLRKLSAVETRETLLSRLPFSREALDQLTGLGALEFDQLTPFPRPQGNSRPSAWVERTYRMPKDAADVIDQALAAWRGDERDDQTPDWKILEYICADWLAKDHRLS
jgi:ParB/RepB/Spo0J family partition protein